MKRFSLRMPLLCVAVFIFFLFSITSMASAMLVFERATYNAHATPGQSVTFTFTFKNTGDSEAIVDFSGISMPDIIEWHAPYPGTRFAPGETKSITLAATLGSRAPKKFDAYLLTNAAPAESAPRIIPLFLVFADGSTLSPQQPSSSTGSEKSTGVEGSKSIVSFCASGSKGSALVIQKAKLKSSGKKTIWIAGNTIDLEVEVENTGTKTLDDVVVELGLRNGKGTNAVRELDFKNSDKQRHNLGDLSSREEETTTFSFKVPASLDEGTYRLILKAYPRGQESSFCTESVADFDLATAQTIKVEREENEQRAIAFDLVSFSPSPLVCGEQAQLTARASNIGDEEQERVKILLVNRNLNLSLTQEISSGLDEGDDTTVTFTFAIPNAVAAGSYAFEWSAESKYKNGAYGARSEIPHTVQIPLTCSRSLPAPTTIQEKPRTLSLSAPEKSKAPAPSRGFAAEARVSLQQALGIGILLILLTIIVVALARRPARTQNPPRHLSSQVKTTAKK